MRFNAFLLPLNSNFLRRGNFKIQKFFQNFNNFSKVTNLHRVKNNNFFDSKKLFLTLRFLKKSLNFFEIGSKQVFAQLNQSPWYRAVNED